MTPGHYATGAASFAGLKAVSCSLHLRAGAFVMEEALVADGHRWIGHYCIIAMPAMKYLFQRLHNCNSSGYRQSEIT